MNVKKIKNKVPWITLLTAVAVLAMGIALILLPDDIVEIIMLYLFTAMLILYGALRFLQTLADRKMKEGAIALAVSWIAGIALSSFDIDLGAAAVLPSIIVGAVAMLMGIMRLMICANCIMNRFPGRIRNGVSAFFCIAFALVLLIHPIKNFAVMTTVAGFYMVFYSVTMFCDAFAALSRSDLDAERQKRRVHFARPNLLTAVKPSRIISEINEKRKDGNLEGGMLVEEKEQDEYDRVNTEIMVHLTTQGANKFGHVDIALGDTIYSYGTYDESTVKMAGFVSQGSIIIVPKIPYLKYCLDHQKKYVIGFGAYLSQKQLENVRTKIDEALSNSERLETEYEKAIRENRDGSEYTDSASNIVRDVGGEVYSVKRGIFRRYFGININCVRFADWLLSESGIDAISFSGLRTPGAYYHMLENMFRRKNTRVIRKTTYIISGDIQNIEELSKVSSPTD